MTTRVLFVCHGNICRSPMGEGMFIHLLNQHQLADEFEVDSAGTHAEHLGQAPDSRMQATARRHGVQLRGRARQVTPSDFEKFDLIIAMDSHNQRNLLRLAQSDPQRQKVRLMREFDPQNPGGDVPDPWYGGSEGFEEVYAIVARSTQNLLTALTDGKLNLK